MSRQKRLEISGLLGFVAFFLRGKKKAKLVRLLDSLNAVTMVYDDARPVIKRATAGEVLTEGELIILQRSMAAMNALVEAIEAF